MRSIDNMDKKKYHQLDRKQNTDLKRDMYRKHENCLFLCELKLKNGISKKPINTESERQATFSGAENWNSHNS